MTQRDPPPASARRLGTRPPRKPTRATQPLRERWVDLNRKLIAGWPAYIELADAGDHSVLPFVAAKVLKWARAAPAADGDDERSREWLIRALVRLTKGDDPNIAFGWEVPGRRHRPKSARELQMRGVIGRHMDLLMRDPRLGHPDLKSAARYVAKFYGREEDSCINAYKEFAKKPRRRGKNSE